MTRDDILKRMKKYLKENAGDDAILSDLQHKKQIALDSMDEIAFNQFVADVVQWSHESKRGNVCGIFGCINPPDFICRHCMSSYCGTHRQAHLHAIGTDGMIKDEFFRGNKKSY